MYEEFSEMERTQIELTKVFYKLKQPWKIADAGYSTKISMQALRELGEEYRNEVKRDQTTYADRRGPVQSNTCNEGRWKGVGLADPLECGHTPARRRYCSTFI